MLSWIWHQMLLQFLRVKMIHPEIAPGFVAPPRQNEAWRVGSYSCCEWVWSWRWSWKIPHFVAKRCDLDSSGDLDMHELKQATRAFGLKFSPEKLEKFMAGESRIDQERFAQIVADSPMTSERPTIPHSLRGMALGQLQQLVLIFINSGWLSTKCNAFKHGQWWWYQWREEVPTSSQSICHGHLCRDTYVTTRPLRCPRSRQWKRSATNIWKNVIFWSGQPTWSHRPIALSPISGVISLVRPSQH